MVLRLVMVVTPEVVSDLVGTGVVDGGDLRGGQHAALFPGNKYRTSRDHRAKRPSMRRNDG
jgi:hypothetical protein